MENMPTTEIQVEMLRRGITQSSLARQLGVSRTMIRRVINHKDVSDRIMRAVADALEIDIVRIWPARYLNGPPNRPGRPVNQ
jgi:lambda repressor-like predicted transcriptional regulator